MDKKAVRRRFVAGSKAVPNGFPSYHSAPLLLATLGYPEDALPPSLAAALWRET